MDTYAPVYYIKMDGQRLPEELERRLVGFEFEDDAEKLSRLRLRFHNGDLALLDHPAFAMGRTLEVRWGYVGGEMSDAVTMTVKAVRGFKTRELIAYDEGHKMTAKARSRVWKNLRYSDIARLIAEEHGLVPVVEDTRIAHEQVAQANQSDLNFLKQLAEKVHYVCYIEGRELHFHPKQYEQRPVLAFTYYDGGRGSLIDFEPVEKTLSEPAEVAVVGVDPLEKTPIVARANDTNVERTALAEGTFVFEASSGTARFLPGETGKKVATTAKTASEAKEQADAEFRKTEEQTVEARIEVVGTPMLRAKRVITLYNLGKRYSGNWYVKTVRHVIDRGYRCYASLERNGVGLTEEAGAQKTSARVNKEKAREEESGAVYQVSADTGAVRLKS